jgi:hypothetical protein
MLEHIDTAAAAGPGAMNAPMPPDCEAPMLREREQLGSWLACSAP